MTTAIFLDRDGIINDVVSRSGELSSPRTLSEFKIRDEFIGFYSKLSSLNLPLFIVSNQPDVARGLLSVDELQKMTESLRSQFEFSGIHYCLHDNNDNCLCRKPKSGLLLDIIKQFSFIPKDIVFIGDSWKDVEAGKAAGVRTVFLNTSYNQHKKPIADFEISSLFDLISVL